MAMRGRLGSASVQARRSASSVGSLCRRGRTGVALLAGWLWADQSDHGRDLSRVFNAARRGWLVGRPLVGGAGGRWLVLVGSADAARFGVPGAVILRHNFVPLQILHTTGTTGQDDDVRPLPVTPTCNAVA